MRKLRICCAAAALVILLVTCEVAVRMGEAASFAREYEAYNGKYINEDGGDVYWAVDIPRCNTVREMSAEEIRDVKDGYLVFAFPTCPYCRNLMPVLTDAANEAGVPLYYCQVDSIRDSYSYDESTQAVVQTRPGTPEYQELLQWLGTLLPEYVIYDSNDVKHPVGEGRIGAPTIIRVRNGMPEDIWKLAMVDDLDLTAQDKNEEWTAESKMLVKKSLAEFLAH